MADIKTVTLTGEETGVGLNGYRCWVRNDGTEMIYASQHSGISEDADNIMPIAAGCSACVDIPDKTVYLKGSGTVQLYGTDGEETPFGNRADMILPAMKAFSYDGLQGGVPFSEIVLGGDIVGQEVTLAVSGKNMLPKPNWDGSAKTSNGVTFSVAGNGTITISGTTTGNTTVHLMSTRMRVTKPLTLASNGTLSGIALIFKLTKDGEVIYRTVYGKSVIEAGVIIEDIYLQQQKSGVEVSGEISPQLECGAEATAYEPYHGSTVTVTPDSAPYTVPNDIRQQDGINNVMVSAGTVQVTGVRRDAALKRVWDKLDELTTAIIVSNGD